MPVDYVGQYKFWLSEWGEDDDFEKLVQWFEKRACIKDETREMTKYFDKQPLKEVGKQQNYDCNSNKEVMHALFQIVKLTTSLGFVQNSKNSL